MAADIPIRNIYYLLCYAWNRLQEGQLIDVSGIDSTELVDLFATVLVNGVNHLMRRGLDQGYLVHEEEMPSIRGRIDVAATSRRMLAYHGKAHCIYDELSVNTLQNQIIKSTLRVLAGVPSLEVILRKKVLRVYRYLAAIDDIPLSKFQFRKIQLHSNNRFYKFLLHVCEMVQSAYLVDEKNGQYKFRDFVRDDRAMARLFESFILNFYRLEFPHLSVKKERLYWEASSDTDPKLSLLPTMETDISIRDGLHTLIIDAKYYSKTLQSYYDSQSIHSGNLYQLMTYLRNISRRGGADANSEGMLLYPVVDRKLRETYMISNHRVHICTIDLSGEWQDICAELMSFVDKYKYHSKE